MAGKAVAGWLTDRVHHTRSAEISKHDLKCTSVQALCGTHLTAVTVEHGQGWQERSGGEADTEYIPSTQISQEKPAVLFLHIYKSNHEDRAENAIAINSQCIRHFHRSMYRLVHCNCTARTAHCCRRGNSQPCTSHMTDPRRGTDSHTFPVDCRWWSWWQVRTDWFCLSRDTAGSLQKTVSRNHRSRPST